MSNERIPTETFVQQNIIAIARAVDQVREEWGGPLGVTSWNRPWAINRRIGSRSSNHPKGIAMDIRSMDGRSTYDLQEWFRREWWEKGRWNGGFGLAGRTKGFIHLDLNSSYGKRSWVY